MQDKFIEEHRGRLAAESNLAIALPALAELRETHAAVLQELDELSAAVQLADQFIASSIDSFGKSEPLGSLSVTHWQATLHQQPQDMWAAAAGAPWSSSTKEKSAVRPQAAEAAMAALITATPPAAGISMGLSLDIKGYLFDISLDITLDIDLDNLRISGMGK